MLEFSHMIKEELIHKSYLKKLSKFYFAPVWQSVFTILYLLFFLYFALFYIGNISLALEFIWHTILHSGSLLGLSYLLWGVAFLITLIVPFSISLYSIFLLYEIWHMAWKKNEKILGTIMIIVLVPLIIIAMDEIIRIVASQTVMGDFVLKNQLNVSGN